MRALVLAIIPALYVNIAAAQSFNSSPYIFQNSPYNFENSPYNFKN